MHLSSRMQAFTLKHRLSLAQTLIFALALNCATSKMIAQTTPDRQRWVDKAAPIPEFSIPASRELWESRRQDIRAQLWQLLGRLPPRPPKPDVQTLSREDHGEYI